jgi:hypothetical protein
VGWLAGFLTGTESFHCCGTSCSWGHLQVAGCVVPKDIVQVAVCFA